MKQIILYFSKDHIQVWHIILMQYLKKSKSVQKFHEEQSISKDRISTSATPSHAGATGKREIQ